MSYVLYEPNTKTLLMTRVFDTEQDAIEAMDPRLCDAVAVPIGFRAQTMAGFNRNFIERRGRTSAEFLRLVATRLTGEASYTRHAGVVYFDGGWVAQPLDYRCRWNAHFDIDRMIGVQIDHLGRTAEELGVVTAALNLII